MLTILVYFDDGFVSEANDIKQFNRIKDQIKDPEWIEKNGRCKIDKIEIGFGDDRWVKETIEYQQSLVPDTARKPKPKEQPIKWYGKGVYND